MQVARVPGGEFRLTPGRNIYLHLYLSQTLYIDTSVNVVGYVHREEKSMRPSDLAKLTGVSTRRLRHYESRGLIHSQRTANGYRDFAATEAEKVRWVTSLIQCGFSTRQIAELEKFSQVSDMDDERFIQCLAQHRQKLAALDMLIALLNERRNALATRIHSYE